MSNVVANRKLLSFPASDRTLPLINYAIYQAALNNALNNVLHDKPSLNKVWPRM